MIGTEIYSLAALFPAALPEIIFPFSLLPLDAPYPPPMPQMALEGIPQTLIEELSVATKEDSIEASGDDKPPVAELSKGSWIQPACLLSPQSLRPPSPKPPSPPAPPPPPPNVVVMESTTATQPVPLRPSLAPPSKHFLQNVLSFGKHCLLS